jgi:hypothetical protein
MTKPDIDAIEDAASFIQCSIDAKKRDATKTKKLTCIGTFCGGVPNSIRRILGEVHICTSLLHARAELAGA